MAVRLLLRLEGLALAVAGVVLYAHGDHSWWLFVLLALAPDLAFVGYVAGPTVGATTYTSCTTSSSRSRWASPASSGTPTGRLQSR